MKTTWHTNHVLDPGMKAIESDPDELVSARVCHFRALRLLCRNRQHTIKKLQEIQRDHINFPNAICNHIDVESNPLDREKTINAMVIDLTARVMHIAWGNPCKNLYPSFYLDA